MKTGAGKAVIFKRIFLILGIAAGIMAIIIGFTSEWSFYGSSFPRIQFGADFYTEMYDITADTEDEIANIGNMLNPAIRWFFIIFGITDMCFFGSKLCDTFTENKIAVVNNSVNSVSENSDTENI